MPAKLKIPKPDDKFKLMAARKAPVPAPKKVAASGIKDKNQTTKGKFVIPVAKRRDTTAIKDKSTKENAAPEELSEAALVAQHIEHMKRALSAGIHSLSVGAVPSGVNNETLLCREQQVNSILQFLRGNAHPTLQLFGMPGTGKTAAVKHAVSSFARQRLGVGGTIHSDEAQDDDMVGVADYSDIVSVIFFNGYVMQKPTDVFAALLRHMSRHRLSSSSTHQNNKIAPHQAAALLEKYFAAGWGKRSYADIPLCVIVIDEMDKCCEHSGKTLFRLVDWLTMPYAKCKMITIANSMQLPERLDAKTRSRLNTTNRVTFPSYSPEQLQHILTQRLVAAHNPSATPYRAMSTGAEEYICRQVGLHVGDVRRLLQTSAAALQELLCLVDDFSEKVKAQGGAVTTKEAFAAMEAFGIPTPTMISNSNNGVAQVRHLGAVARNVLHDRFQDYLASVASPLVYTTILLTANESIKQSAMARAERSDSDGSHLSLQRLYLLVKATLETYGQADAPRISFTQFLLCVETLRQVNFLEISVGANEERLFDATAAVAISSPVFVAIVQPPQDVIARCEGHDMYKTIGKHLVQVR